MITTILILHGLLAVALLGAVTHQAFSTSRRVPVARRSFVDKFRAVDAASYAHAIVMLFVATCIGGALLYPPYRLDVRPTLEDLDLRAANGVFEIKEHLAAIGLGLLPAYWFFWRQPLTADGIVPRRYLTWILAFVIWWNFLVGHVLNNIRGLFPMMGHGRFSIFSISFGIVYTLAFYFSIALFRYYPLVGQFHVADQPKTAGPPISWYGWIVTALLVSLPLALIVPRRWADRLSPIWAGLIPAALVFLVLIYEKRWFF